VGAGSCVTTATPTATATATVPTVVTRASAVTCQLRQVGSTLARGQAACVEWYAQELSDPFDLVEGREGRFQGLHGGLQGVLLRGGGVGWDGKGRGGVGKGEVERGRANEGKQERTKGEGEGGKVC
jgi:hypothetical protein